MLLHPFWRGGATDPSPGSVTQLGTSVFQAAGETDLTQLGTQAFQQRGLTEVTQVGATVLQDGVGNTRITQVSANALQQAGITRMTQIGATPIWRYSRPVVLETQYMRRLRRAPHLCGEQKQVTYHEFELDLETGAGIHGSDAEPQIMLRWSDDGGEYSRRVIWRRLGKARDRVFEITVSDPIAWRFVDAFVRYTGGRH
jgi:hypothetical protein